MLDRGELEAAVQQTHNRKCLAERTCELLRTAVQTYQNGICVILWCQVVQVERREVPTYHTGQQRSNPFLVENMGDSFQR
jgi:hypothetical protein